MIFALFLLSLISPSLQHVGLWEPQVFVPDIDRAPLKADGSNFPCKGTMPSNATVTAMKAGSIFPSSLWGVFPSSATHGGGSCQWSLSYDNAKTFIVIHSRAPFQTEIATKSTEIGGCPAVKDPSGSEAQGWPIFNYSIPIPSNAPSGQAIFSWTWFNLNGNREMYQDCSVVEIQDGGEGFEAPTIYTANIGDGCITPTGAELILPNPGLSLNYGGSYSNDKPPSESALPDWQQQDAGKCKTPAVVAIDAKGSATATNTPLVTQSFPQPITPTVSPTGYPDGPELSDTPYVRSKANLDPFPPRGNQIAMTMDGGGSGNSPPAGSSAKSDQKSPVESGASKPLPKSSKSTSGSQPTNTSAAPSRKASPGFFRKCKVKGQNLAKRSKFKDFMYRR